ncbi:MULTISPECIES: hypothetical protein [Halomonas]|uniref:phage tail tip fiber protein n=1 Tax=Halomonas TaxID=2745 RepID=UPI001C94B5A4|nr:MULTISPECIES: hypothetical protein [Halomonas]MBY6209094.1 hypothetical protein [Halomonas sp. DP3Y7-2]MBY6229250.1 hypothetical protein [Halomonas sp. DP3Y7-1]MCA0917687.1 hypothetical protein [Halomonas denitrificans]
MTTNRRKTLPPVSPKVPSELRPLISAMTEIIETGEGVRGNPLDQKLTYRDLLDSGLAALRNGARPGQPGSLIPGVNIPAPDMTVPPAPTGFHAVGGFYGMVTLTWDNPGDAYGNHAYTNIYRSVDDNFANAELVGRDSGMLYSDIVRNDVLVGMSVGYYYWITFTSTAGVEGPPNDGDGTYAAPLIDVQVLLETLAENLADEPSDIGSPDETLILHANRFAVRFGANEEEWVYPLVVATVNGKPTVVLDTAIIRDGSIQEGQLGPITIGKIEKNDGTPITTVSGLIRADAIDADNLSVAEAATFYGVAQSNNYVPGQSGWMLHPNGFAEFGGGIDIDYSRIGGSKPPSDADKTSTHTAYDTSRVAGTSASTVRDRANNGNAANSRVNQWTRPGSTLIWGNQISTADAYVDTLQIKGNAVIIPVSVISSGLTVHSSVPDQRWYTMISGTINSEGQPVIVTFSAGLVIGAYMDHPSSVDIRVLVNGSQHLFYAEAAEANARTPFSTTFKLGGSSSDRAITVQIRANRPTIDGFGDSKTQIGHRNRSLTMMGTLR